MRSREPSILTKIKHPILVGIICLILGFGGAFMFPILNVSAMDEDISDEDVIHAIYIHDIQSIDQLEQELAQHIQDFSCMEVSWKVDNPLSSEPMMAA